MPKQGLLEKPKRDRKVREILAWPFDFDLSVSARDADWFHVKPDAETTIVACDGTGGIFLLYGADQKLIHVTSEGQAGVIARDLEEGLRLMVTYPYWRDLLKFSGGGKLKEMRRVAPYLARELHEDQSEMDKQRTTLMTKLSLKKSATRLRRCMPPFQRWGKALLSPRPMEPNSRVCSILSRSKVTQCGSGHNKRMKLTGAAILVSHA